MTARLLFDPGKKIKNDHSHERSIFLLASEKSDAANPKLNEQKSIFFLFLTIKPKMMKKVLRKYTFNEC